MGRAGAAGRCSRQRRDGSHKDPESTETTMSQRESRGRLGPKFRVLQTPQNLDSVAFLRSLFLPPTPVLSTASPPSSGQAVHWAACVMCPMIMPGGLQSTSPALGTLNWTPPGLGTSIPGQASFRKIMQPAFSPSLVIERGSI